MGFIGWVLTHWCPVIAAACANTAQSAWLACVLTASAQTLMPAHYRPLHCLTLFLPAAALSCCPCLLPAACVRCVQPVVKVSAVEVEAKLKTRKVGPLLRWRRRGGGRVCGAARLPLLLTGRA